MKDSVGMTPLKAIITGSSGAVGQALVKALKTAGHQAVPWNRAVVPIDDYEAMLSFITKEKPDAIFHLAMASKPTGIKNEEWLVNWHWPSEIAWITQLLKIRYIYTSSVMVWTDDVKGPILPTTAPNAIEGYGAAKIRTEERLRRQNSNTTIARLGWQIGDAPGSNNMIDFLYANRDANGVIRASGEWLPSCSFVSDTAKALIRLAQRDSGTYLLNSNRDMSFFEIAEALSNLHENAWTVEETEDFAVDQRMIDERTGMPDLRARIAGMARESGPGLPV